MGCVVLTSLEMQQSRRYCVVSKYIGLTFRSYLVINVHCHFQGVSIYINADCQKGSFTVTYMCNVFHKISEQYKVYIKY
jgi:hypothetical protein